MFQNKKLMAGVWFGLVTLVIVGGGIFTVKVMGTSQPVSYGAASLPGDQTSQSSTQSTTPTTAQSGASLQANNSTSGSTQGLLGASTSGSQSASQGQASGSAAKSNPFDPTTFAQYDKYKEGDSALMGDAQTGDGATLEAGKTAVVYYRGWLTNGTMFDQSRTGSDGKLQPFSFTVGSHQVISGWEQGLVGMKVGGVRLLIVPPSVGYGASAQGSIPPNSVLVFQVQLVAVQ